MHTQAIARHLRENEGKLKELRDTLAKTLQKTEKQRREADRERASLQASLRQLVRDAAAPASAVHDAAVWPRALTSLSRCGV